jgi:uncharacterized protein (TIGR03435 family)
MTDTASARRRLGRAGVQPGRFINPRPGQNVIFGAILVILSQLGASGQSVMPDFEAASVRASHGDLSGCQNCSRSDYTPGHFTAQNVALRDLVSLAYSVKDYQFFGAPGWLSSDRFDIAARAADPASQAQVMHMLQSLLAERFHLALHRETRDLPLYVLSVGKNGPKLTPGTDGAPGFQILNGALSFHKLSMSVLADRLPGIFKELEHRPVLDKTGIDGLFDFVMKLADTDAEAKQSIMSGDDRPSVFEIMQEQFGLKLELQKVPADVIVIDHVERIPIPN